MGLLGKMLIRRRHMPRVSDIPVRVLQRMTLACRELSEAEASIARRLGLSEPPRLLLIDEEEALIVTPADRDNLVGEDRSRKANQEDDAEQTGPQSPSPLS